MTLYALVFISGYLFSSSGTWISGVEKDHIVLLAQFKKVEDCQKAQEALQRGALPNTVFSCVPLTGEKKP